MGKHTSKDKASDAGRREGKAHRHRGAKALVTVLAVVAVLCGGAAAALAIDDGQRTQTVPTRTLLDGSVDVSGMTAEQLETTIRARFKNGIASRVELELAGDTYEIDLARTSKLDPRPTVEAAFAPYRKSTFERYADRLASLAHGETPTYQVSTSLVPSKKKLARRVEVLAEKVEVPARSAGYRYSSGKLVTVGAQTGKSVDVDATVKAIRSALSSGATGTVRVKGVVKTEKPAQSKPGQAILVDTSACRVFLYEGGRVRVSYPCSPGKAGYETPRGNWTLSYKDAAPTWTNPHSDWSQNMPETIGPGASNPLGLRALAVSCGGGIYIHGTMNTAALGRPDSHGCIRLANDSVVELFEMVSAGIPIIIR